MAPLIPIESAIYAVAPPPDGGDDDRLNLDVRTGAALIYTTSTIVVHGGLTVGLDLEAITIPLIEEQLQNYTREEINNLISSEMFHLDIINRQWTRFDSDPTRKRPKPRLFHSITSYKNSIFLFGGLMVDENEQADHVFRASNDLWEYSLDHREWYCLDDGSNHHRYDHSAHSVVYISPIDKKTHHALAISGGRGEFNQELTGSAIFDLENKSYVDQSEMHLHLHEVEIKRNRSFGPTASPAVENRPLKVKVTSESGCVLPASSDPFADQVENDCFHIYSPHRKASNEHVKNPLVSLPIVPYASGLRFPISPCSESNPTVVPNTLKYPSGGIIDVNVFIAGLNTATNSYEAYQFNKPSQKWIRLNLEDYKRNPNLYLWKSFVWESHNKLCILGSMNSPQNAANLTIQTFELIVLVDLPVAKLFHGNNKGTTDATFFGRQNPSIDAYSKQINIKDRNDSKSIFPEFAADFGREAIEQCGSSLSDFEIVTADGNKISAPLMLLRKRWGRFFDMLLSQGYARVIHKLEIGKDDDGEKMGENDSIISAKRSILAMTKASNPEREVPEFRLPFQEKLASSPSIGLTPASNSSNPQSRKASVVSVGNSSIITASSNDLGPDELDLHNLPPQLPFPTEPVPTVDKFAPLKGPSSSNAAPFTSYSPRGSTSGMSTTSSVASTVNISSLRLTELRSSSGMSKKGRTTRQTSLQPTIPDDASALEEKSIISEYDDDDDSDPAALLEPLLTPRSLYLPYKTNTVSAMIEFLLTGQLGEDWPIVPVVTDNFLLSNIYGIPSLHRLISEAFYSILHKKEASLMGDYNKLAYSYKTRLADIFDKDKGKIDEFYKNHPHVQRTFTELETYVNTLDDGFLNTSLLKRLSKTNRDSRKSGVFDGRGEVSREVNTPRISTTGKKRNDQAQNRFRRETFKFRGDMMMTQHPDSSTDDHRTSKHGDYNGNDDDDALDPLAQSASHHYTNSSDKISDNREYAVNYSHANRSLKDLDVDDPLSVSNSNALAGMDSAENNTDDVDGDDEGDEEIHPLNIKKSKKRSNSDESQKSFQLPEGRFAASKSILPDVDSNEDVTDSEGYDVDSDFETHGLGMLRGLHISEQARIDYYSDEDDGDEDGDEESRENSATLGKLRAPNSPAPGKHLLKVILETAGLACDLNLLIRSSSVLEMSKFYEREKVLLTRELDEYELNSKREGLKEVTILKKDSDIFEVPIRPDIMYDRSILSRETTRISDNLITVPINDRNVKGQLSMENYDMIDTRKDDSTHFLVQVPIERSNTYTSKQHTDDDDYLSDTSRETRGSKGSRGRFPTSFRSMSSLSGFNSHVNKSVTDIPKEEPKPKGRGGLFSSKKHGDSDTPKKGGFFSKLKGKK